MREPVILEAAIDVFPEEPSKMTLHSATNCNGIENVILTPHIGGSTREAQENIARDVAEKMAKFLTTGTIGAIFPRSPVSDLIASHPAHSPQRPWMEPPSCDDRHWPQHQRTTLDSNAHRRALMWIQPMTLRSSSG